MHASHESAATSTMRRIHSAPWRSSRAGGGAGTEAAEWSRCQPQQAGRLQPQPCRAGVAALCRREAGRYDGTTAKYNMPIGPAALPRGLRFLQPNKQFRWQLQVGSLTLLSMGREYKQKLLAGGIQATVRWLRDAHKHQGRLDLSGVLSSSTRVVWCTRRCSVATDIKTSRVYRWPAEPTKRSRWCEHSAGSA